MINNGSANTTTQSALKTLEVFGPSGIAVDPWCVNHREGWCILVEQPADVAPAYSDAMPTRCAQTVILPLRIDRHMPTCQECRALAGAARGS